MINGKGFSEEIVQHLTRQIVDALKYLHSRKIIHRDLKLENLLINFEAEEDKKNVNMLKAEVKLIDFGFSTFLDSCGLRYSILGSPINMDPILLNKLINQNISYLIGYDEKADIWSLGTVCYELLVGEIAFKAQNMVELIQKIELGIYHIPTNSSQEFASFLNCMLQYNSKFRLSADELSRHPFLNKSVNEFTKIDLSRIADKIDEKGIIINIKTYQNQQQLYFKNQNFNNNTFPKYLETYNNYGNIVPKYYMANTNQQFGMQINILPTQIQGIQTNIYQNNQNIVNQPYKNRERNLSQGNQIPVDIKFHTLNPSISNKNFHNQNSYNINTDYTKRINKSKNSSTLTEIEVNLPRKKKLFKVNSYTNLPISTKSSNIHYRQQKYRQSISRQINNENNFQTKNINNNNNTINLNRHLSIKYSGEFFRNQYGLSPSNNIKNHSPILFSRFQESKPMSKSPISFKRITKENNYSPNKYNENLKINNGNYNNSISGYGRNPFFIIEPRKEASPDTFDRLYNMNIEGELPPEPEIVIIRNK
jgi:serine/threonine protein kinase